MSLPKSIRLDLELEKKITSFLKKNNIKFSQLIHLALSKFISEPQTIELEPISPDDFVKTAEKAFKKHKHAMDLLK